MTLSPATPAAAPPRVSPDVEHDHAWSKADPAVGSGLGAYQCDLCGLVWSV